MPGGVLGGCNEVMLRMGNKRKNLPINPPSGKMPSQENITLKKMIGLIFEPQQLCRIFLSILQVQNVVKAFKVIF